MIKIKEINKIENRQVEKVNETQRWFIEKINKIDTLLK